MEISTHWEFRMYDNMVGANIMIFDNKPNCTSMIIKRDDGQLFIQFVISLLHIIHNTEINQFMKFVFNNYDKQDIHSLIFDSVPFKMDHKLIKILYDIIKSTKHLSAMNIIKTNELLRKIYIMYLSMCISDIKLYICDNIRYHKDHIPTIYVSSAKKIHESIHYKFVIFMKSINRFYRYLVDLGYITHNKKIYKIYGINNMLINNKILQERDTFVDCIIYTCQYN
jgi:hypothetical protein